jgi:fumarate reductase flavoprotein subunit
MAGLCAAARARELGLEPFVIDKGERPGGSMLLSSCVIWRHREFDDFRAECPGGIPELQRLVWERLDDALDWLESLGAPVVARETGNRRTVGRRFDPLELTEALLQAGGGAYMRSPLRLEQEPPVVLATGGFGGSLAERLRLLLRANPWSSGDGLWYARARGAVLYGDVDEFYGRNMPAPPARVTEQDFVRLSQLYGRYALVVNLDGEEFAPGEPSWSENDLVQKTARQPWARAWYVVDGRTLRERVRERTVAEMVDAADAAGGEVRHGGTVGELGLELPRSDKLREPPFAAVLVQAAVTHTIAGLRVDEHARLLDGEGAPIAGIYAAGADVGGIATGGYASGLAAALVLGLVAAETAAQEYR